MFKETRVGIVITDFTGPINYQTCSDEEFMETAEEQGSVWTLKGFEQFIYTGKLAEMMKNVQHPNYLVPRFCDLYEDYSGNLYYDDEPKKENDYEC